MDTQENVLLAACEVFSLYGYHAATTAEICSKAAANIAAVNYIIAAKRIYNGGWEKLFSDSMARRSTEIPLDGSVRERLFALLRYNIMSVLATGSANWFTKIVHKELSTPSPMHSELFNRYLEPIQNQFLAIVREFLGAEAGEQKVRLASLCVHGPVYDLAHFRIKDESQAGKGNQYPLFSSRPVFIEDPETLISHSQTFVIGGLEAIRDKKSD